MSELTPCNYCVLQNIKNRASREGNEVTVRTNTEGLKFPKGLDVFVHPKNAKPEQRHWACWFMELGNHCVC